MITFFFQPFHNLKKIKKTKINVFQTFPQKEKIKYFIKNMLLITQITLRIVVRVQIAHHG